MLFDCVATTTTTIIIICSIRRFGGILSSSRVADVKVNWLLTDILLLQLLHETMGRRRGEKGGYRNLFSSSYYLFFFFGSFHWSLPICYCVSPPFGTVFVALSPKICDGAAKEGP